MDGNEEKLRRIGEAIARRRTEEGLSQQALSRMIGQANHSHLSRVERGEEVPNLPMIFRLAEALDVEVAYFFIGI